MSNEKLFAGKDVVINGIRAKTSDREAVKPKTEYCENEILPYFTFQ
jgi:hypothetical protein